MCVRRLVVLGPERSKKPQPVARAYPVLEHNILLIGLKKWPPAAYPDLTGIPSSSAGRILEDVPVYYMSTPHDSRRAGRLSAVGQGWSKRVKDV